MTGRQNFKIGDRVEVRYTSGDPRRATVIASHHDEIVRVRFDKMDTYGVMETDFYNGPLAHPHLVQHLSPLDKIAEIL